MVIAERGALNLWHRELREGKRTVYLTDALWKAACYEMNAREYVRWGLPTLANDDRRRAIQIIDEAGIAELPRATASKSNDPFQSVPVRRSKGDPFAKVLR